MVTPFCGFLIGFEDMFDGVEANLNVITNCKRGKHKVVPFEPWRFDRQDNEAFRIHCSV
jgi:hypothetical protein